MLTPKDTAWEAYRGLCGLLFYTEKKKIARYCQKSRKTQGDYWHQLTQWES
jgi:hypothetical protein